MTNITVTKKCHSHAIVVDILVPKQHQYPGTVLLLFIEILWKIVLNRFVTLLRHTLLRHESFCHKLLRHESFRHKLLRPKSFRHTLLRHESLTFLMRTSVDKFSSDAVRSAALERHSGEKCLHCLIYFATLWPIMYLQFCTCCSPLILDYPYPCVFLFL